MAAPIKGTQGNNPAINGTAGNDKLQGKAGNDVCAPSAGPRFESLHTHHDIKDLAVAW